MKFHARLIPSSVHPANDPHVSCAARAAEPHIFADTGERKFEYNNCSSLKKMADGIWGIAAPKRKFSPTFFFGATGSSWAPVVISPPPPQKKPSPYFLSPRRFFLFFSTKRLEGKLRERGRRYFHQVLPRRHGQFRFGFTPSLIAFFFFSFFLFCGNVFLGLGLSCGQNLAPTDNSLLFLLFLLEQQAQ